MCERCTIHPQPWRKDHDILAGVTQKSRPVAGRVTSGVTAQSRAGHGAGGGAPLLTPCRRNSGAETGEWSNSRRHRAGERGADRSTLSRNGRSCTATGGSGDPDSASAAPALLSLEAAMRHVCHTAPVLVALGCDVMGGCNSPGKSGSSGRDSAGGDAGIPYQRGGARTPGLHSVPLWKLSRFIVYNECITQGALNHILRHRFSFSLLISGIAILIVNPVYTFYHFMSI